QPGTCFWVGPALFEQGTGGLDQLQLGLELFDTPTGRLQGVGLVALGPRALTGVYESLSAPAIERVVGDPELGHEIFDCLTGEHSLTRPAANLGGVLPWHVWLLMDRAKLSQGRSTIWGKGQTLSSFGSALTE